MNHVQTASNPFALLMDPEAVVAAVERSARLGDLKRRICRPLDKPLIPHAAGDSDAETAGDDDGLDASASEPPQI